MLPVPKIMIYNESNLLDECGMKTGIYDIINLSASHVKGRLSTKNCLLSKTVLFKHKELITPFSCMWQSRCHT